MKIKILCGITAGIIGLSLLAFGLPGADPKTYADCILENMKDAQSNQAASLIARSCRLKFPEPIVYMTEEEAFGESTVAK